MKNAWSDAESLVHEALDVHGEDREGFLEKSCQKNDGLRQEVDLLIEKIESLVDHAWVRPAEEREAFLLAECRGNDFVGEEARLRLKQREQSGVAPDQIASLLLRLGQGDKTALDSLTPLVIDDLRRLAYYLLRSERPNHTLQPTALVNEMYIKFTRQRNLQWQDRAHFIAIAARAMRQILIDYAKRRKREKNGGDIIFLPQDDALNIAGAQPVDFIELNEALERLAIVSARKEQVVVLRFFGGLNNDEIAVVLQIAPNTVIRDWEFAKAWLNREMKKKGTNESGTPEED
jgi:RNA polymerase sigma factor (TIGR02999 family)